MELLRRHCIGPSRMVSNSSIDPSIENQLNKTHFYSFEDQDKIVDLLIRYKVDVNIMDYHGRTPLFMAARNGNKKIVESLIEAGADVNTKDKSGTTPYERASERGIIFHTKSHNFIYGQQTCIKKCI